MITVINYRINKTIGTMSLPYGQPIPDWLFEKPFSIDHVEVVEGQHFPAIPDNNCLYGGNVSGHSSPYCTADSCY